MRDIPTRRGWAPFVGAALAALTAGSLITFSVVAQRTSLDGMSDERVIAASPAAVRPPSITIPPVDDGEGASPTGAGGTTPAAPFLTVALAPPGPTTSTTDEVATDEDVTVAPLSPSARLGGPLAAEETFLARTGAGGRPAIDGEDGIEGWDERHDGKHSHKSHDVKANSNGSGKAGSTGNRSRPRGGSAKPPHGRGHPNHASSSGRSHSGDNHSGSSAAPAKHGPSPKARPAPAAKKWSNSRPAAKAKSRGRGRGRR